MTIQNDGRNDSAGRAVEAPTLRQRAEEKARATADQDLEALSIEEARRLLHQLRVRQIELEMQNEELRRTQEELELIIDSVPAFIAYLDSDLQVLHVNRRQAEWWGYSKEQVVGKNFKEIARPDAYELIAPYLRQAVASRKPVTHEVPAVSSAGQSAVGQVHSVPHLDEQGNVLGLVVMSLDVTKERRVEKELRTQQEKLELIIDSVPAFIAYLDSDLRVLHVNRRQAEWWGYSKEQVVGKHYGEVANPDAYEQNAPYLRQAVASRQPVTHEFRAMSSAGQHAVGQVNSVPHLDEQGNALGLVALSLDVTKQRQAEEALRASEERYRLLVENMREGLAIVDEDALLTYVNDSLCAMTGWARDELLGQSSLKLFPSEGQERHQDWLARRREGLSDSYEAVFRRRDGGKTPVLISASPILDPQGNYRGSLAVCTDITERVEAEEALRRRVEELTALNRIAHTMAAEAELPTSLVQASEIIAGLFAAHCVHIIWREGEEAGFHLNVASEPGSGQAGPIRLDVSPDELTVDGRVLREARSQVVEDVRSLPLSDLEPELLVHRKVQSILFVPLVIGGTTVGLLRIASDQPGSLFTANEMRLAETIAVDLAAAIDGARLSRQAQLAAVADERSRLARELHDSITQTLYSVSILAEALPRVLERDLEDAKRTAGYMRQVVLGALAEMRTLLFELRPDALDAADLGVLLGQLAASLRGRGRVGVDLNIDGKVEPPTDIKIGLYRIAQETCNNIARHAGATHVTAAMQNLPDRVLLTIQDDGQGFDPDSVPAEQMGLRIMRERAEGLGLQLVIESQVGRGTKVAVTWQKDEGQRTEEK